MIGPRKNWLKGAALALAACAGLAGPAPADAQLFLTEPAFQDAPIEGSDPLVGLPLPGATPAEYRAHLLWNLRSGLNVSALQCQFSPYLRTVGNYNSLLAHHSGELASAYTALMGYFTRTHGPREGARRFDEYSTTTYNNFSTFQAQMGFCQTASQILKEALTRPKGELNALARERMRRLRGSLVPFNSPILTYQPHALLRPTAQALTPPDCSRLPRRQRRECERNR